MQVKIDGATWLSRWKSHHSPVSTNYSKLTRLNEIIVLLIEKNLRDVLAQAKSYVILLLSRLVPPTLVLGEHFMLKDLPFYEVLHLADTEARQARLNI